MYFACYNVHSAICIEPARQKNLMDQLPDDPIKTLHGSPVANFRCRCKQSYIGIIHSAYQIIITIITLL